MSEGTASAQRINDAFDIEESQRRFMESVEKGYFDHGEYVDLFYDDCGMEMLVGVMLTVVVCLILGLIYAYLG